jgi:hypothetical protein
MLRLVGKCSITMSALLPPPSTAGGQCLPCVEAWIAWHVDFPSQPIEVMPESAVFWGQ